MSDLISRQAAIEAINHICPVDTEYDCTLLDRVDVRCVLLDLPSAQPEKCEDAVSREEAKWVVFCHRDHVEDQANAIDELPSVRPSAQQWIPVSERLPGYGEDVLLSVCNCCTVGHCVSTNRCGVDWYYDGWYHPENDVDAWMPLPEPWKGEEG